MGFLKKAFNLVVSPSHSRTALILIGLIIFAAIPLTIIVSQQQQSLKQRAAGNCTVTFDWTTHIDSILKDGNSVDPQRYFLNITSKPESATTLTSSVSLGSSRTSYSVSGQPNGNYTAQVCSGFDYATRERTNCVDLVGDIKCTESVTPTATLSLSPVSNSTTQPASPKTATSVGDYCDTFTFGLNNCSGGQKCGNFNLPCEEDGCTGTCVAQAQSPISPTSVPSSALSPAVTSSVYGTININGYTCPPQGGSCNIGNFPNCQAVLNLKDMSGKPIETVNVPITNLIFPLNYNTTKTLDPGLYTISSSLLNCNGNIKTVDNSDFIKINSSSPSVKKDFQIDNLKTIQTPSPAQSITSSPTPSATATRTPTNTPTPTPATSNASSGYTECTVYYYSDQNCTIGKGSYPLACQSNNPGNSKKGCMSTIDPALYEGRATCQPCTPPQTNVNPSPNAAAPTKTPTPTPVKDTILSFQFKLQGITAKSLHKRIKYTVTILDQQKNKVKEIEGIADDFDEASNIFKASLVINENNKAFPAGSYFVKVKVNKHLVKQTSAPVTITSGATNNLTLLSPVIGDMNADNKIDILDYNVLAGCFGKKAELSSCTNKTAAYTGETGTIYNADLNDDGVIDGIDYNTFIRNFNSEGD